MKLLELEVASFRGIRHLHLKPNGKNMLLFGPNGAGKSSVVDALDFLLTGSVSRLAGPGSRELSLSVHGPHIDATPRDSWVRAVFKVDGVADPVTLVRSLAPPRQLDCPASALPYVKPALDAAKNGVHLLNRRNMLQYIATEPATRAQQVQSLLSIGDVDSVRRALVRVANDLGRRAEAAKEELDKSLLNLALSAGLPSYDRNRLIELVNQSRAVLAAPPVQQLDSRSLKDGIAAPASAGTASRNRDMLERAIDLLLQLVSDEQRQSIASDDSLIRGGIAQLGSVLDAQKEINRIKLIALGISLLDETGACPLCEYPWEPGELRPRLERRLEEVTRLRDLLASINERAQRLGQAATTRASAIKQLLEGLDQVGVSALRDELVAWHDRVQTLESVLRGDPILGYLQAAPTIEELVDTMTPEWAVATLSRLRATMRETLPDASAEQQAWDMLTRVEERLKIVEEASTNLSHISTWYHRAEAVQQAYESAQNEVLSHLYESVADDFKSLYSCLHEDERASFKAVLGPTGAGLDFKVDFYGRGLHAPHALHSEAHQDSMGLCLFLALNRRLAAHRLDLVMLDDVVMSVDAEHRRSVARLLKEFFTDRQLLITTHDRTWARQLRVEGIIPENGQVELQKWSIALGPLVSSGGDIWDRIYGSLDNEDVNTAAFMLRRHLEEFYSQACEQLKASIVCKLDGRWDLGDLLPSAISRVKRLLTTAENAARSWGDVETAERIADRRSTLSEVVKRTSVEQWAINPAVHFSHWEDFTPADFRPVVEAFHDLEEQFRCSSCRGLLGVLENLERSEVVVKCPCGKTMWHLESRKANMV